MNLEPFHNYENPANDSTELNGSSLRASTVDETSGGTTSWTWIVYNGDSNTPSAEFNGSGTLLERYLAGPSYVPGVTGMIARTNASGVIDWYLTGKLGSVRDIVNTSGTVIDHISYGAFGTVRAETNPSSGSQFKFEGMVTDGLSGLYHDYHRSYNSKAGRFIQLDQLGYLVNRSNLYIYVGNTPTVSIDPSGYIAVFPEVPLQEPEGGWDNWLKENQQAYLDAYNILVSEYLAEIGDLNTDIGTFLNVYRSNPQISFPVPAAAISTTGALVNLRTIYHRENMKKYYALLRKRTELFQLYFFIRFAYPNKSIQDPPRPPVKPEMTGLIMPPNNYSVAGVSKPPWYPSRATGGKMPQQYIK